jgi:hypothetical protein
MAELTTLQDDVGNFLLTMFRYEEKGLTEYSVSPFNEAEIMRVLKGTKLVGGTGIEPVTPAV